jgi:hypothetical protein
VPTRLIRNWARKQDISPATLDGAKRELGVLSKRYNGAWWWGIPKRTSFQRVRREEGVYVCRVYERTEIELPQPPELVEY